MNFSEIESAFEFVSMDQPYAHRAYLSKTTGETFYQSEMNDFDELPEDIYEIDDYIEIPHKNDLGLGQRIVWQFVEKEIPGLADKVRSFFSRKGAYSKYKAFLEEIGLLINDMNSKTQKQKKPCCNGVKIKGSKLTANE